ncbi:pseudaminic acid synthase [Clostridium sp. D2Q-11]|uniref:Pseudaminic acid synthase n=1 Tax=Anaeromonas frigoriresistens TaxID=2683708 RepID=A0A942UWS6_9FIRM|nr:pseudaminic acid synthase [Anaeromonas frigoriresistens]MBS4537826.1 pseudaminic acid synthase [Anaeromonas frigoriresistens]
MNKRIKINDRFIGDGYPSYIIAEMSANHAGDIDRAIEIIHAAKEAGADCIKIQTYTADTMTIDCDKEYFKIKKGTWEGENLYKLYEKAYTPWEWQARLKEEAESIGLDFLSTPFDKTAVDFLEELNVKFYKIASFELVDIPLIRYIASKGKPIIMSTGMGTLEEIEDAVNAIRKEENNEICLLKCSSAYPAVPKDMNLKTIEYLKSNFGVIAGLSDHTLGSLGAVTAVALGAKIVEKHFCISREIENPDSSFSMEPHEFKKMVQDIRIVEKAIGKVDFEVSEREHVSRGFRRSIFVVKDMKKGDKFTEENMRIIRPGYGIKPKYYDDVVGKRANRDIERGTPLNWDMVI